MDEISQTAAPAQSINADPADVPDALRQRRHAFAVSRHREAAKAESWWWVGRLAASVRDAEVQGLVIEGVDRETAWAAIGDPDIDRYFHEFYRALSNGLFGPGPRARVLMVSPEFGARRLTPERAKNVVERRGWDEFAQRYAPYAWIEIDRAEAWLWTWLDQRSVRAWVSMPRIQEALAASRAVVPRIPIGLNPSPAAPAAVIVDPWETEVRSWLAGVVASLETGQRLTRGRAFTLAKEHYPEISEYRFEQHIYRPPTIPREWLQRGRPRGSRNTKGR